MEDENVWYLDIVKTQSINPVAYPPHLGFKDTNTVYFNAIMKKAGDHEILVGVSTSYLGLVNKLNECGTLVKTLEYRATLQEDNTLSLLKDLKEQDYEVLIYGPNKTIRVDQFITPNLCNIEYIHLDEIFKRKDVRKELEEFYKDIDNIDYLLTLSPQDKKDISVCKSHCIKDINGNEIVNITTLVDYVSKEQVLIAKKYINREIHEARYSINNCSFKKIKLGLKEFKRIQNLIQVI